MYITSILVGIDDSLQSITALNVLNVHYRLTRAGIMDRQLTNYLPSGMLATVCTMKRPYSPIWHEGVLRASKHGPNVGGVLPRGVEVCVVT